MTTHLFTGRDGSVYSCACPRGVDHNQEADDNEIIDNLLAGIKQGVAETHPVHHKRDWRDFMERNKA